MFTYSTASFRITGLIATLALGACMQITSTGQSTVNGETVTGRVVASGISRDVTISFERGRICKGVYQRTGFDSEIDFPIACSDGTQGEAKLKIFDAHKHSVERTFARVTYNLGSSGRGAVDIPLGGSLPKSEPQSASEPTVSDETAELCSIAWKSGMADMAVRAFAMRDKGVSQSEARRRLGSYKSNSFGWLMRESALIGAYSNTATSASGARIAALATCAKLSEQQ